MQGKCYWPNGVSYRIGRWGKEMDKSSSKDSNLQELRNLVETLENMQERNELDGVEFFFMDNSTVEVAYYKGSSSSVRVVQLNSETFDARNDMQLQNGHHSC